MRRGAWKRKKREVLLKGEEAEEDGNRIEMKRGMTVMRRRRRKKSRKRRETEER